MVKADDKAPTPLISKQEMIDREHKYQQRIQEVIVSSAFIKEAFVEFEQLEAAKATQAHWEHHLRCDGLPRPYIPPEMRKFLAKRQSFQQFDYDHSVDWTLSVDERTILTQDISRVDRTRNTMKQKLDDHIGDRFKNDICMYLATLLKIECMLDNPSEMARVEFNLQMEIMAARKEIEKEIDDSFDRLTYRIIRMDGVYMNSTDAIVATWGYKCDRFDMDIWCLRDVPIRFDELKMPMMIAEMVNVGASVQMPLSVLHDCLTLRCIHTNFDNYSQYAKSFDAIIPDSMKDLPAGILDIADCLAHEWDMQLDVQQELLENMLQKREEYEELMRLITERTERAAKEAKNDPDAKSVKLPPIPKPTKEPIKLPPDMLPDAMTTFLDREHQEYLDMLDECYNPVNLKLKLSEINLRQYIILGGVFSIMFIRRSLNTHYEKFNIILHEDGHILHIRDDIVANIYGHGEGDSKLFQRGSTLSGRAKSQIRLNLDAQKRKTTMLEDDELPYFYVTLQLAQDLCLWGEPVVCQYITEMENIESEESIVDEKKESIADKKKKKHSKLDAMKKLESTKLEAAERQSEFQRLASKEESINVFRPTLISLLRHSKAITLEQPLVPVGNFSLLKKLNHSEIRRIERYCVPRLISSFKMPQEVREEIDFQRPKAKNLLMRPRAAEVEETIDYGYIDFNYDDQHAPERLYPVFPDVEHVFYDEHDLDENDDNPDPKSLFGVLDTFDAIRLQYNTNCWRIWNQTDFDQKKGKKTIAATSVEHRATNQSLRLKSTNKSVVLSRHSSFRSSTDDALHTSQTLLSEERTTHTEGDHISLTEEPEPQVEEPKEPEKPKVEVTHWTTKHIFESRFDRHDRTMIIKTDRLGIFGLAYKRYEHFPFRDWSLQPNEENSEEIILTVDTFHARVVLYISAQGVRGYVTDLAKGYVANPVKYLDIPKPVADFRVLHRLFYEKSINIFAAHDASFYIDNGYFSVKHVATEDHTYGAMAMHCKLMKFYRSSWNRLASRRNILLCMKNAKDISDHSDVTIRITPDSATFVEVSELCSDDLDVIKLNFRNTWRNLGNYTDLHQTILSMNPHAMDVRNKDTFLLFQIKRLLREIHILNYS
ncbi:hypothetical protein KR222_003179 [Zaprionus bogoriensis]|nr:hypothetical protein KR222_003179 [Zaprionus bogoriensis]